MLLVKFSRRSIINISLPLKKDKRMFKYHSAEEPQSAAEPWSDIWEKLSPSVRSFCLQLFD